MSLGIFSGVTGKLDMLVIVENAIRLWCLLQLWQYVASPWTHSSAWSSRLFAPLVSSHHYYRHSCIVNHWSLKDIQAQLDAEINNTAHCSPFSLRSLKWTLTLSLGNSGKQLHLNYYANVPQIRTAGNKCEGRAAWVERRGAIKLWFRLKMITQI